MMFCYMKQFASFGNRASTARMAYNNILRDGMNITSSVHTDVNECAKDEHNCHVDGYCTNTDGSFVCTCQNAYTGDGVMCSGELRSSLLSLEGWGGVGWGRFTCDSIIWLSFMHMVFFLLKYIQNKIHGIKSAFKHF